MLEPENRHLLTDALRPPDGFVVERALATTYTLDLTSVLLAPLAMAAYDQRHEVDVDGTSTPLALLESVRRHAEHTTVLCQAAGIHVPPAYSKLAAFAEGCVAEVAPPPGRTFHPKIWVLRFVDQDGRRRHRFACLSRNLTGDRSWDTVLICDEVEDYGRVLDPAPISTFVEELLDRTLRLDPSRREQIRDLCSSLRGARLALPEPFTEGRVVPLGTPSGAEWPLPETADSWAVVSPFLDVTSVARLPQSNGERILLSRPDTFERLGTRALESVELRVLQPLADLAEPEGDSAPAVAPGDLTRGLHAKVFVWQADGLAHLLTGSANCTGAAFGGNIEMSVLLSGPISDCGLRAAFGDDSSGFLRITQGYSPREVEPRPDPVYQAERLIEAWHAAIAASAPRLLVSEGDTGFDLALAVELPHDPDGLAATTRIRPVGVRSLPFRPLAEGPSWRGLNLAGLTPYLAVSTTMDAGGTTMTRDCVLVCEVVDAPEDRLARLLRELLARQEDVLRYLALLLGDPSVDDLLDRLLQDAGEGQDDPDEKATRAFGVGFDDLVLLEPLVRAAARGDASLLRAHQLLEDLRDPDGQLPQLSTDFLELWRVVWEARE